MPEKPQARGLPIPPGRTVPDETEGAVLNTESVPVEAETVDNMPDLTPEEEKQVDMLLGTLKDFIWDEGYNAIVEKIKGTSADQIPKVVGDIAGRMVNREVMAADKAEAPVSRDILFGIGAEVVNELFELAADEGSYKATGEKQQENDQGEALIYAVQKYGEMGDPNMNPQGLMQLASSALKGGYPQQEAVRKMGVQVAPETEAV
jgi:hypothetical protein|tara:strand:+ start:562 stop:1176 length:615 start_codon:yes stop_codon:yes gene_type:complete